MVKDWVSVTNLMNPIMGYMLICCICALYRCSKLIICELYKCVFYSYRMSGEYINLYHYGS